MKPFTTRAFCMLLLFGLFISTQAAPAVIAERTTRQSDNSDFVEVVQVLISIVDGILGDSETIIVAGPKPVEVVGQLLTIQPFLESESPESTEEVTTNETDDEALPSPESDSAESNIPYKLHIIEATSGKPDAAVIILHGIGQTIENVKPLAFAAKFTDMPNVRFIMPQANMQHVTFFNETMPSWFDITSNNPEDPESRDEILQAAQYIADIRDLQETEHGIPADRVAIVGFSQGGALALTAYMRYRWAAVTGISSWLPLRESYPAEMITDAPNVKLSMIHGAEDEVVLPAWARISFSLMKELGRKVEYVELPGEGHQLEGAMAKVLIMALDFLREHLV